MPKALWELRRLAQRKRDSLATTDNVLRLHAKMKKICEMLRIGSSRPWFHLRYPFLSVSWVRVWRFRLAEKSRIGSRYRNFFFDCGPWRVGWVKERVAS